MEVMTALLGYILVRGFLVNTVGRPFNLLPEEKVVSPVVLGFLKTLAKLLSCCCGRSGFSAAENPRVKMLPADVAGTRPPAGSPHVDTLEGVPDSGSEEPGTTSLHSVISAARHSVLRQAMLAFSQPVDHAGALKMVPDRGFDIGRTIFASLNFLPRLRQTAKMGNHHFWDVERVQAVLRALSCRLESLSLGQGGSPAPEKKIGDPAKQDIKCESHDPDVKSLRHPFLHFPNLVEEGCHPTKPIVDWKMGEILELMRDHCDFSCEHADGSFLDHLEFCRDYSALHYSKESPRILFLHSILGAATNQFPLPVDKIDKLQNCLTPREFLHVQCFPTMLRLMKGTNLLSDIYHLWRTDHRFHSPDSSGVYLKIFRVIDNAPLVLSLEELWVQLNLMLIHSLDFIPEMGWKKFEAKRDPFLDEFLQLSTLLRVCGQLRCDVRIPKQFRVVNVEDHSSYAGRIAHGSGIKLPDSFRSFQCVLDRDMNIALGGEQIVDADFPDTLLSKVLVQNLPAWVVQPLAKREIHKLSNRIGFRLDYKLFAVDAMDVSHTFDPDAGDLLQFEC